jgi:N-acetylneuraminate synthase
MKIGNQEIGIDKPTYFIADIAANHDGELSRALDLISLAKTSGADAAKFQHFRAEHIVSDKGFRELSELKSHQSNWGKSVYEVYREASLPWAWTTTLAEHAKKVGIHFFTSPYDFEAIDFVDEFVPAYKIGSGDITWLDAIDRVSSKAKPVILATGAASLLEVRQAVKVIEKYKVPFSIMQCNTNYTGSDRNLDYINLNVLNTYKHEFPNAILGLSDHTHGSTTVLGAVALGARIIEKHFTDDVSRSGPDHHFSMTPKTWSEMIKHTREMECALGSEIKKVEDNERETVVLQRRGLRYSHPMRAGEVVTKDDVVALRPATPGSYSPNQMHEVIGKKILVNVDFHTPIRPSDFR